MLFLYLYLKKRLKLETGLFDFNSESLSFHGDMQDYIFAAIDIMIQSSWSVSLVANFYGRDLVFNSLFLYTLSIRILYERIHTEISDINWLQEWQRRHILMFILDVLRF